MQDSFILRVLLNVVAKSKQNTNQFPLMFSIAKSHLNELKPSAPEFIDPMLLTRQP